MIALFHKEARQVLIAHAVISVLYCAVVIALAPHGWMLLPQEDFAETYFVAALAALVHGLLIGIGTFGLESWGRTEAYLIHRCVTPVRAFLAKTAIGLLSLALVLLLPIACYGVWYLVLFPSIEGASAWGLWHLAAATTAGAPALAIAVFAARLRKTWFKRWLLALLGVCTLILVVRWAAGPIGSEVLPSALRFATMQLAFAAALLGMGCALFRQSDDVHRPWRGWVAVLAAATSLALFWTPYAVGIGTLQGHLRSALFRSYPLIYEDTSGELLRVVRDAHHGYWRVDEQALRLTSEPMNDSPGLGAEFIQLFSAAYTPLTRIRPPMVDLGRRNHVGPFEFEGPFFNSFNWFQRAGEVRWSQAWVDLGRARIASLEEWDDGRSRLEWFDRRADDRPFSPSTVLVFPLGRNPDFGNDLALSGVLLADRSDGTLWGFERRGAEIELRPVELPGGDRLERIERLHSRFSLRVGLYEPFNKSSGLLFVGQRERYAWTRDGFVAESTGDAFEDALDDTAPESEASMVQVWRLEPSDADGLAFHLDVVDAKTGEVALAHDYQPRTVKQRALAASALVLSFARPPVGELTSFVGRPYEEREVFRRSGQLADPFVGNGVRAWLLLAVVGLGIALAVSTWRWIGSRPDDRGVRWFWTIAVAALGLPAWVLCRVLEPSRHVLTLRLSGSGGRSDPIVRTPRQAPREAVSVHA
jgi:hypothetical protein